MAALKVSQCRPIISVRIFFCIDRATPKLAELNLNRRNEIVSYNFSRGAILGSSVITVLALAGISGYVSGYLSDFQVNWLIAAIPPAFILAKFVGGASEQKEVRAPC